MRRKPLSILAALVLSASCASTDRASELSLPFHVALIPLQVDEAGETEADGDLTVHIDAERADSALLLRLDRECFAVATLLRVPSDVDPADFAALEQKERDALWVAAARAAGADLILEGRLTYEPRFTTSSNEKFWLNLPLFLLGGPFCYFIDDRSYRGRGNLRATLHDLPPLLAGRATLDDGRARILDVETTFRETELDFLDRVDGLLPMTASLLVPAGLLQRAGPRVSERLAEQLLEELCDQAAADIRRSRGTVAKAERTESFYLDPAIDVLRDDEGPALHASVLLNPNEADRIELAFATLDAVELSTSVGEAVPDAGAGNLRQQMLRLPVRVRLPPGAAGILRLELLSSGRNPDRRSFSIDLAELGPPPPEPSEAASAPRTLGLAGGSDLGSAPAAR